MKLQVEIALIFLICVICIEHIFGDGFPVVSSTNKWTCTCFSANGGNQGITPAMNCSSSCDCSPAAGGSHGSKWTCICDAGGFPKVVTDGHNTSCFTSCNCSSGFSTDQKSSKKHYSSKVILIILLLCLMLATFAFIASLLCYIYRRDKFPIQQPFFSSDKEISCHSTSDLIIQNKPFSVAESKVYSSKIYGSFLNPDTGCIHKPMVLFKSKRGIIHGANIKFSCSELENATNNFSDSNLIGVGGSSRVYHGQLQDGRTVAVKRIKAQGGPYSESIFSTEIELLSRLHHCNLVPLLGYCSEYQGKHAQRLLVFEYLPNGNLRECLDRASGKFLDWGTRVAIALGAARGLEYLHEAAAPRILHRDVKSTNILLDDNWRAKITDLGMAKHLRSDGIISSSSSPVGMQGTFGYFAPEYAIVGRASLKSDVFSFGVVLLELITGQQPIHKSTTKADESLVLWAMPRLQDSKRAILELPDIHLTGKFPEEEMQMMAYLAKECLSVDPDSRPTMSEVVQILSAIALDKSGRKRFPLMLFQNSSFGVTKKELDIDIERANRQVQDPYDGHDIRRLTSKRWSPRSSLPLDIDRTLCAEQNWKERHTSAEYIDRLILLKSNARSWHSQDGEAVDLTEPRLESFCMENMRSCSQNSSAWKDKESPKKQ